MEAEFKCCPFYCVKFGRLLNTGTLIYGSLNIDVADESSVGIYHNGGIYPKRILAILARCLDYFYILDNYHVD